jgi:hypothetical protein
MNVVPLPHLGRAKIWLGELPALRVQPARALSGFVQARRPAFPEARRAALEIVLPRGATISYGLLGAELHPSQTGRLLYEVAVSEASGSIFEDSIAVRPEEVRVGLPEEYAPSVVEGILEAERQTPNLVSGRLLIHCAAHGIVGSSRWLFARLARTLTKILTLESMPSSEEEAASHLSFEP